MHALNTQQLKEEVRQALCTLQQPPVTGNDNAIEDKTRASVSGVALLGSYIQLVRPHSERVSIPPRKSFTLTQ